MTEDEAMEILENIYEKYVKDCDSEEYMEQNFAITESVKALSEIQQYRAIGTVEECREAREKQRRKKPILYKKTNRADCPMCGNTVRGIGKPFGNWCSKCGQAIEWSEQI